MLERQVIIMMTAKIFENGRSQAVRLPKEYRFSSEEVFVNKIGETLIIMPKESKWESFMQAIDMFSSDYLEEGRSSQVNMERESL